MAWLWQILDQPEGPADNLTANNIQNPQLTPTKEGSYLLQCTVNNGFADQKQDKVNLIVADMKTLDRVPSAGETLEVDTVRGWATAVNRWLARVSRLAADSGVIVGVAGQAGLTRGHILRPSGVVTIKNGLPGQERLMSFTLALGTTLAHARHPLFILEGDVAGNIAPANGALIRARHTGLFENVAGGFGGALIGDPLYLGNTGFLEVAPGTVPRELASVLESIAGAPGTMTVLFDGHTHMRQPHGYLMWGNTSTNAAAQCFLDPCFEDRIAQPIGSVVEWEAPGPGRFSRMRVSSSTGPVGASQSFRFQRNGVNMNLVCTLVPPATANSDLSESDGFEYAAGDKIRIIVSPDLGVITGAVNVRCVVQNTPA